MPKAVKRNSRYQVQIRCPGGPEISKTFHILKDAEEWVTQMQVQADGGELAPDRKIHETLTRGDLVNRYRDEVTIKKKSAEVETFVLNAFLRHPICKQSFSIHSTSDFAKNRDQRLNSSQHGYCIHVSNDTYMSHERD